MSVGPDVHHATSAEGTAILDTRTGRWLMLDPDASRIWRAITVRGTVDGLADEIAIPAGADPAAVQHQITQFLKQMTASGLLVEDSPKLKTRWKWWR